MEKILANSWETIVKEAGKKNVIFAALEGVNKLFQFLAAHPEEQFTVVSGYSDFSLNLQSENKPNHDLQKHFYMVNWKEINESSDYRVVQLGPSVSEDCNPKHRYSIKIYAYTTFTFDEVPHNLKRWYCTNLNVEHPKMDWIPFGINEQGHGKDILLNYKKPLTERKGLLYINQQDHTVERVHLKEFYSNKPFATVRKKANLPVDKFYEEMSDHKFVLCAHGNGYDQYRVSEAMLTGGIPILPKSTMAMHMAKLNLPVVIVDNMFNLTEDMLNGLYEQVKDNMHLFNYDPLNLDYWRFRIFEDA